MRELDERRATVRDDPRQLCPTESHVLGPGRCLLEPRIGDD